MNELGQPCEHRTKDDRGEAARQTEGQADPGHPADQDDGERQHEQPRVFPAEEGRTHRDEGNRNPGEGAEHRGTGRIFPHRRSDESAEQHDDADDEAPNEAGLPGQHRVLRLQIDRQHNQEDDDEHVRHARPVGHCRHIAAPLAFGQPPGKVGVVEVAERQRDAERRQDAAVDDAGRQVDDVQAQPGQHNDVEDDVGEQTEEAVPVARNPPARRGNLSGVHHVVLNEWMSGVRP